MISFEKNTLENKQEKLNQWLRANVLLASSSSYRKQELENFGFTKVTSIGVPEEIERRAETNFSINKNEFYQDKYDFGGAERIAKAKVEYLLRHQVSDDMFVIAADTMPVIFRIRDELKAGQTAFEKQILHKPESEDFVKKSIMEVFFATLQAWIRVLETIKDYQKNPFNEYTFDELADAYKLGFAPLRVQITTGVAIRFPNQQNIETFRTTANIVVGAVIQIANNYQNQLLQKGMIHDFDKLPPELTSELENLADELIETTKKSGVDPTKVAGGINWGDSKIQRLLMVQDTNETIFGSDEMEKGVYLGLPIQALNNFLDKKSEK